MARGNIRNRRASKNTLLIFTEGMHDYTFMNHLKKLYGPCAGAAAPRVTIKKGRGGSIPDVVRDSLKVAGEFSNRVVKLDSDRGAEEIDVAKALIEGGATELHFSDPCLEALLLQILEPRFKPARRTSAECKRRFEDRYIPSHRRGIAMAYDAVFDIRLIESARARLSELDALIILFVGG